MVFSVPDSIYLGYAQLMGYMLVTGVHFKYFIPPVQLCVMSEEPPAQHGYFSAAVNVVTMPSNCVQQTHPAGSSSRLFTKSHKRQRAPTGYHTGRGFQCACYNIVSIAIPSSTRGEIQCQL